jgi:hypothetical protein
MIKHSIILCAALLLLCQAATAEVLYWSSHDCGGSGSSFTAIVKDDFNGSIVMIFRGCDGTTCHWPMSGGIQTSMGELTPPTNLYGLSMAGSSITTPGADVGVYMLTINGDTARFRNPVDEVEHARCIAAWERESASMVIITTPEQNRHYTELLNKVLNDGYREELVRQERSNMIVSASDGTLTIRPIDYAVADDVTVTDAAGCIVWSGYVERTVSVPLPPGPYTVQSNAIPVMITVTQELR